MSENLSRKDIKREKEVETSSANSVKSDESGQVIEETRVSNRIEEAETENAVEKKNNKLAWLVLAAFVAVAALIGLIWIVNKRSNETAVNVEVAAAESDANKPAMEIKLEPETVASANLEYEGVTQRPAVALLRVTGTVESNQQQTQQITPLVSGRVERINVAVGDRVSSGTPVAVISSPEIAELRGKFYDATTRLEIAERNYERVQRAENRVGVLSAQAKLNEAEANLNRTKRLIEANILSARAKLSEAEATLKRTKRLMELGAGAGRDLVAAEANYKVESANLQSALSTKDLNSAQANYQTAKADYDFQNNISLNREIQEARSAVETTRVDVTRVRDQLKALGASVPDSNSPGDQRGNTSLITLYAPVSGAVTERMVNDGAGIEAAKPLFTIANISTVWVVASVPEMQIGLVRPGTRAEVSSAALGTNNIVGQVSYVDPQLNEETRTARVRIVVENPGERLKVGMFAQIGFQTATDSATGEELVVPAGAIQRIGTKTVVFLEKKGEAGAFEVREVETGGDSEGYTRILSGLKLGEMVVTKGSFILKTQLEKGAM